MVQATALYTSAYDQSRATLKAWMSGKCLKPSDTVEGRREEEDAKIHKKFLDRVDKVCQDIARLLAFFAVVCVFGTFAMQREGSLLLSQACCVLYSSCFRFFLHLHGCYR